MMTAVTIRLVAGGNTVVVVVEHNLDVVAAADWIGDLGPEGGKEGGSGGRQEISAAGRGEPRRRAAGIGRAAIARSGADSRTAPRGVAGGRPAGRLSCSNGRRRGRVR